MGAGKSTIGKMVARRIGYKFYDTDQLMVKGFRKPISQVFQEHGEPAFRKAELQVLEELSKRSRLVISTGGGTLGTQESLNIALNSGTVVYLKADVDVLFERVIFSPKDRPILDEPDTEAVFKDKFHYREQFYNQSHFSIRTGDRKSSEVVDDFIKQLIETDQKELGEILD